MFDDEEEDDSTPGTRVAADFSGSSDEEDPIPYRAADQQVAPEDQGPDLRPAAMEPQRDSSNDDTYLSQMAGGGDDDGPIEAPKAPVFQPYSNAPIDDAQQYAQMQKDFAGKVASGAYKPSIWRKIGGALSGGAVAFGSRNPALGIQVANDFVQDPLNKATRNENLAEQAQRSKIDAGNAQNAAIQRTNQNAANQASWAERDFANQARVRDWQAQANQRKAMAQAKLNTVDKNTLGPVDPQNPMGEWQGKTPGGQTVRGLEPPEAIQKDPRYQRQSRMADVQDMLKRGIKMTPDQQTYYVVNGKLAQPTEHTTISVKEGGEAKPAAVRRGTPGQFAILDRTTQAAYDKAEKDYRADLSIANTQEEKDAALAKLNQAKATIGATHSQQLRDLGGIPAEDSQQGGGGAQPGAATQARPAANTAQQPAAAPAQQAPKTFSPAEVPKNVSLPPGHAWVKDPNGVIGHIPQANVAKAIQRGYAILGSQ